MSVLLSWTYSRMCFLGIFAAILQSYQPSLLTDEEIVTIYKEFKDSFDGNEKALYGAFMKHLTQNYAYRYEGGKVRSIVSGV